MRHTKGAHWNMERDRNRHRVVRMVDRIMTLYDLDWIALCESGDYVTEMHRRLGRDYWVLAWKDAPGMNNTSILVSKAKHPHRPTYSFAKKMTRQGWITVRGGRTPPKYMVTTMLFEWLRIGAVHFAPSVHSRRGRLRGPWMRLLSYRQHARSLVDFFNRQDRKRSILVMGDYNNPKSARGLWTPRWMCQRAYAKGWFPSKPTHHRATIDGAIGRNVSVTSRVVRTYGSDHHLVLVAVAKTN